VKNIISRLLLTSTCFLCAAFSQADSAGTTKFSAPAEYCFPQTSIRSELGKFDKVTLDHNLIVNEQDHFKTGDIFVGFRRKSQSDALWLTNGTAWFNATDDDITPKTYPIFLPDKNFPPDMSIIFPDSYGIYSKLQPVMPITLSRDEPIDASTYIGDGEVWVGYGLRTEEEDWKKSFKNMMENQRFQKIWEISGSTPSYGVLVLNAPSAICLTATEMKTVPLNIPALPGEVILDIDNVGIATKP